MVLGIDVGGTSTRIVLAEETTGAPILEVHGQSDASGGPSLLDRGLCDTLHAAAAADGKIMAICAGITKISRAGVEHRWRQHLAQMFPGAACDVVADYVIAFHGATGGIGISIVAGTGSVAYGQDRVGTNLRIGGRGWEYGDEGSGAWMTAEVLRRALRVMDGIEEPTPLTSAVLEAIAEDDTDPAAIAENGRRRAETGGRGYLVPLLVERAYSGDREARSLFVGAAGHLALLVKAVGNHLNFRAERHIPVATVGGLWETGELLLAPFRQQVRALLPRAEVVTPVGAPVAGAVARAVQMRDSTSKGRGGLPGMRALPVSTDPRAAGSGR